MLLDLSHYGPLTVSMLEYPTTVAVRLDVPSGRDGCGVFAGRNDTFGEDEMGKLVAVAEQDEHVTTFLLDRPERVAKDSCIARWTYAAIGWSDSVYVEYPHSHVLTLAEHYSSPDNHFWSLSVNLERNLGFVIDLSDYEPGWLRRNR